MEKISDKICEWAKRYGFVISCLMAGAIQYVGFVLARIMPPLWEYCSVYSDTTAEIVPFIKMFYRNLFQGEYLLYSWETSLGQNTSLIYSFCAYSPFNLVYLIIDNVHLATTLALVFRVAFSALCFHLFLDQVYGEEKRWNTLLAVSYALCSYQQEYILASNMMEGVWILPLVMLCLIRAFKKRRFALLTFVYAYSFIINFYLGFLIGLFSFLVCLICLILRDKGSFWKKWKGVMLRYFGAVVIAIFISMLTILPAMFFLAYSGDFDNVYTRYIPDLIEVMHAMYAGNDLYLDSHLPFLYCGWPVLLLVPLYFADRTFMRKEKMAYGAGLLFLLISFWVDPLYYMLHIFNRPDGFLYRYVFLIVFLMVFLAGRELKKGELWRKKDSLKYYYILQVVLCLLVCIIYRRFRREEDPAGMLFRAGLNTGLLLAWGLTVFLKNIRFRVQAVYFILAVELCFSAYHAGKDFADEDYTEVEGKSRILYDYVRYIDTEKQNNGMIARASFPDETWGYDSSAEFGYMGIGQFSTAKYTGLNRLMSTLGDGINNVRYTQTGATDLTDMLFGVRYHSKESTEDVNTAYLPEEYEFVLPLGFLASSDILQDMEFGRNVFENQNTFLSALCGEDMEVYVRADAWDQLGSGMNYSQDPNGRYSLQRVSAEERSVLLFGIPENDYDHAYFYFQIEGEDSEVQESKVLEDMATNISLYSEADRRTTGKRFQVAFDNSIIEMTKMDGMFQILVENTDSPEKIFTYQDNLFYYQDDDRLLQASDLLRHGWNVRKWENDHIEADVSTSGDRRVLFMSIPYDKGWSARVDGKETGIIPCVNNVFMAIPLSEGEHRIELDYEAPGETWGKVLFCLGMVLFGIELIADRRAVS